MATNRYGESLNAVLLSAQRLAIRRGQALCEPQHLLWALLSDDTAAAASELRRDGFDVARIRQRLEAELPPPLRAFGDPRARSISDGVLRISPAVKAVLDAASELAADASSPEVDEQFVLDAFVAVDRPDVRDLTARVGLTGSGVTGSVAGDSGAEPGDGAGGVLRLISQYGRDLTAEARAGRLDPVIGREDELRRVTHILGRRRKNNPVLIGEPGVGKTAIVEGLAQAIAADEVPEALSGKHIFALDIGSLVAGTKYRGEFEERIQVLLDTLARARGSIILFIDELHLIARAGGAEGAIDAASFFKPLLARGDLHAIGATTVEEYREHIARDGALERRFQPVFVREPTAEETLAILRGLRSTYEGYHRVSITDASLEAAVRFGLSHLPDRRLPDKAIDLIDEAASERRAARDSERATREAVGGSAASDGAGAPADEIGTRVEPDDVRRVVEEWVGRDAQNPWTARVYGRGPRRFLSRLVRRRG